MAGPNQKRRARRSRGERGVALIIVVVAITLLTVVATEFAYNSRVDLEMAANNRDEVRAYYMARSGVGLSRLLLSFQKQAQAIQLPPGLANLIPGLGGAGGAAPGLNLQLWKMARVDCHMLKGLVPEEAGGTEAPGPGFAFDEDEDTTDGEGGSEPVQMRSFGNFEGCFLATLSDEEQKLNVQRLDSDSQNVRAAVQSLLDLFGDKRFEFLFQHEDANRVKASPTDVLLALRDWIDEDETGSALNTGAAVTMSPVVPGFSDENGEYQRFEPRYHAKNARFDSLDELYRVHGVNDRFMAAFKDRLTVYPDHNRGLNINSDDPLIIYASVLAILDPTTQNGRNDPRLQNPVFVQELIKQIQAARMFSFIGMSVRDFANLVQSAGLAVNQSILGGSVQRGLTDKSETFSIKSVGEAGDVQKTITTVVRIGQADGPLGRLVYWREE